MCRPTREPPVSEFIYANDRDCSADLLNSSECCRPCVASFFSPDQPLLSSRLYRSCLRPSPPRRRQRRQLSSSQPMTVMASRIVSPQGATARAAWPTPGASPRATAQQAPSDRRAILRARPGPPAPARQRWPSPATINTADTPDYRAGGAAAGSRNAHACGPIRGPVWPIASRFRATSRAKAPHALSGIHKLRKQSPDRASTR